MDLLITVITIEYTTVFLCDSNNNNNNNRLLYELEKRMCCLSLEKLYYIKILIIRSKLSIVKKLTYNTDDFLKFKFLK